MWLESPFYFAYFAENYTAYREKFIPVVLQPLLLCVHC